MIRRFLMVDDDPDDLSLFEEALKTIDNSIEFHQANGCNEVFAQMKQEQIHPEIIFLDINMPDRTGWDCLAAFKNDNRLKNIPVVMYSTSSVMLDGKKAITRGASGFFEKPTSFEKLFDFLSELVPASSSNLNQELKRIASSKTYRLMVG